MQPQKDQYLQRYLKEVDVNRELQKKIKDLERQIDSFECDYGTSNDRIDVLEKSCDELRKKLDEALTLLEVRKRIIDYEKVKNQSLTTALENEKEHNKKLCEENIRLANINSGLVSSSSQDDYEQLDTFQLIDKISVLEEQLEAVTLRSNTYKTQRDTFKRVCDDYRKKLEAYQDIITKSLNSESHNLREEVEDLKIENAYLKMLLKNAGYTPEQLG